MGNGAAFEPAPKLDVGGDETAAWSRASTFAHRQTPAPWLHGALNKLDGLLTLSSDWDSYGASAIDSDAVGRAKAFVRLVASFVSVPEPTLGASGEGHPAFSWDQGAWSLDASINSTGLISYVYIDEENERANVESCTRDARKLLGYLTQWN